MCGITFIKSKTQDIVETYKGMVNTIQSRGPDNTISKEFDNAGYFYNMTFHRLCINDLTDAGNQPMKYKDYYLICNGEIFNHKKLIEKYNFKMNSESDCEVILHLYDFLINNSLLLVLFLYFI